jgi:lipopolysaccharide/colanic/teichoic acid biosynthesis glycosyltransferase
MRSACCVENKTRTTNHATRRKEFAMSENELDPKAAKMLEMFAMQQFNGVRSAQRVRLRLVTWVLRNKIAWGLKRVLDVFVSIAALIALSPLMLGTAIAIKLDSPGPVFFKQTRVGKYGVTFGCYKFRSMYIDAEKRKAELAVQNEADGPVFKIKNDPRITRVGRIIRKLSIDELPQLINVLRGEMSLVGPRPFMGTEIGFYDKCYSLYTTGLRPQRSQLQTLGRTGFAVHFRAKRLERHQDFADDDSGGGYGARRILTMTNDP